MLYITQSVLPWFDYDQGSMRVWADTYFLNELVTENRFITKGWMRSPILEKIFFPKLSEGVMSLGKVLSWAKCIQTLDMFVSEKDGPTVELAMPIQVNAKAPFLRFRKKSVQSSASRLANKVPYQTLR